MIKLRFEMLTVFDKYVPLNDISFKPVQDPSLNAM